MKLICDITDCKREAKHHAKTAYCVVVLCEKHKEHEKNRKLINDQSATDARKDGAGL